MKNSSLIMLITIFTISLISCRQNEQLADGYGNFEAEEITVSAENNGKIISSIINEGDTLKQGTVVMLTDTVQLALKIPQLSLQKRIIAGKREIISSQLAVIEEQLKSAVREKERSEKLLPSGAVPVQQFDNLTSQVDVLEKQLVNVKAQGLTINDEIAAIETQIVQIKDQISRCYVKNPITGTVLAEYAHCGEIVQPGKPLYKIADLKTMNLKVFVSGSIMATLKIGQVVKIKTDGDSVCGNLQGTVSYISEKAEFTPKIIQTKEERVNQVYAVKISVINNGTLKIGMPGEAVF